jgi:arylsulfatase A-like enzyme
LPSCRIRPGAITLKPGTPPIKTIPILYSLGILITATNQICLAQEHTPGGDTKASTVAVADKPNIVFIMADDLGNADLGYRGSQIKTPNIDKLATTGVRLESFYGMPVCTPSRASLMTGRYAMRYGLQTLVIFPSHTCGLPADEQTLPQALKDAGYRTLMVGKWHLGHADKKYWPQSRGFDYFYGNVVGEGTTSRASAVE